ncbi:MULTISPECIES: lipoprotein LpqH [Mycobacterium]|uniref:lipoprotein LpqH n=1 Tax=Mycobacterium TaxID=1763 RepID=UPI001EF063AB|nr:MULTISPECIES: lipoprotein LpqH [Mycobacterium]BDE12445.1 lipoprotein [Mycobacterium sp. 20KCMC460]GLC16101.1 lipoprotein [Mycobacterium kiyosense]GLC21219.1 lipoprotein [Mycobacterium kiyosense]
MKRELLIVFGAAALVAGMAGCSKDEKSSGSSSSSSASSSAATSTSSGTVPASPAAAAGETKVLIGGQPQPVGPVVCETYQGKFSIQIGDPIIGVIVGLEQDGSAVHSAGLGTVDGVVLSFTEGAPGNSAKATKNGSTYQITGTATGVDNAGAQVSKTFEVDATCP